MQLSEQAAAALRAMVRRLVLREAETREDAYARTLRGPLRGLWTGQVDEFEAWEMLDTAIEAGLTRAFHAGARDMGIEPDELTATELAALEQAIVAEKMHIDGLIDRSLRLIEQEAKLGQVFALLQPWYQRYRDLQNRARALAGADKKLQWWMDFAKEHCSSCLKLHGKVKRASQWIAAGILPQNPPNDKLECGGWQ